ncbi:Aste57867_15302 [Aphanomyces stellatus]|uniref:Aste57867_15302 protein n=1 Tax=Aphanomyces stellatus TaxID=120398 RepID=A0A485L5Q0_9STRA|nr:hypothetical protein As57867_015246 [Aphanomyces stellatus]VFT92111.1 Aste57867_15302 [Aphanomyces stellatus]
MVGQGLRFALARVVARQPKSEGSKHHKSSHPMPFTHLQAYAHVSQTFLETAARVLTKTKHTRRSSTSASNSNGASVCPLLRSDTLEELDWSLAIDVDSSKARPTIGHTAALLLDLWDLLLLSCEHMLEPALEASMTDFGEKMKWEKTELLVVKLMERREFQKVYDAFVVATDDKKDNNAPSPPATSSSSMRTSKKKHHGGFLSKRSTDPSHDDTLRSTDNNVADDPLLPLNADAAALLTKYMTLLHRTFVYASSTDIRSVMSSTLYNSVFSISFCRLPRAQAIILAAFDGQGFHGAWRRQTQPSTLLSAKRTFFEDDNPALFGWAALDDTTRLQPTLDAIYDTLRTNLALLTHPEAHPRTSSTTSGSDDDDGDNALPPRPAHAASSLCVSMFLALWIAMTHHILRTGRGHIPWRDIPAYHALHARALVLFEKAYALQTLECDDDSNLVRFDLVARRRDKLHAAMPVEILYPQVVFATTTKILSLTRLVHDFAAILFKHTNIPYARAVPPCVAHLEHWIGVLPMDVFKDERLRTLLVTHVRKILLSDRVDRLKSMLVFLLHCTGLFDLALQADLLRVLLDSFSRLFRHWFRDVRFCYHLNLLYLFGDRRALNSHSDAILLGLDTDDMDLLDCHPTWLPFDEQLLDALDACRHVNQTTPYDRTSFNEYIGQLEHYYQNAEALPAGEAVPIPRIKLQVPGARGGGG